jgi:hypothetical protein
MGYGVIPGARGAILDARTPCVRIVASSYTNLPTIALDTPVPEADF